jgi:hypothetical protein
MKCGICYQGPPVWLWTLRPKEWSVVFVIRNEWELLRSQHPALWEQYRDVFEVVDPPWVLLLGVTMPPHGGSVGQWNLLMV